MSVDPWQWDDTLFVHAAALAAGLDCLLAANGTLLVGPPGGDPTVPLAQGVAPATSQATAAVLAEQDIVREMLRRAGVPTPPSRTCTFVDGVDQTQQLAAELGYPVILRGGWLTRRSLAAARALPAADEQELAEAVAALRKVAGPRADRPSQPRGRFMVERRVAAAELHALVVEGRVIAATHQRPVAGSAPALASIPLGSLDTELAELLIGAARTIPDLPVASVHCAVDAPAEPARTQPHAVTGLGMHPWLPLHDQAEPGSGIRLAAAILESAIGGPVPVPGAGPPRSVRLRIGGLGGAETAAAELTGHLGTRGIDGALAVEPADGGTVGGVVTGPPDQLATLANDLFAGRGVTVRPLYVEQLTA
jgi:predicted kinase